MMRLFVRDCILLEQRILLVLSMLNFAVGVSVWISDCLPDKIL